MGLKQRLSKIIVVTAIAGFVGLGLTPVVSFTENANATTIKTENSQTAVKNINEIYNAAIKGTMPRLPISLKIGKNNRTDVRNQFGLPPKGTTGEFDYYHAEMGHPGYAFGYDKKGVISEIRYFGTNVERQTNLGSITENNLKKELGKPNFINKFKSGDIKQTKYTYHAGAYDLEFIFNNVKTLDHVNVIPKS
ncbi:hypothetical protein BIV60_10035 [Bacillus sp. MUM 116]|uniref:YjgB family protein n=1 Tax=Bacillus sp. MUM 116 TaxID=1678002 RepID=UPI0008F57BC4|nr:YjgB family protein [Bacillus sp. MUM 116]OIK15368.1 hypothetical protein BIV60_10035 [Bacillus sp. MUM 116]